MSHEREGDMRHDRGRLGKKGHTEMRQERTQRDMRQEKTEK